MIRWTQLAVSFIFGVVFIVVILLIAIWIPQPTPAQYATFKTVLALAAAGIAGTIPGLGWLGIPGLARIGGAALVFAFVYSHNPASLLASKTLPVYFIEENRRVGPIEVQARGSETVAEVSKQACEKLPEEICRQFPKDAAFYNPAKNRIIPPETKVDSLFDDTSTSYMVTTAGDPQLVYRKWIEERQAQVNDLPASAGKLKEDQFAAAPPVVTARPTIPMLGTEPKTPPKLALATVDCKSFSWAKPLKSTAAVPFHVSWDPQLGRMSRWGIRAGVVLQLDADLKNENEAVLWFFIARACSDLLYIQGAPTAEFPSEEEKEDGYCEAAAAVRRLGFSASVMNLSRIMILVQSEDQLNPKSKDHYIAALRQCWFA